MKAELNIDTQVLAKEITNHVKIFERKITIKKESALATLCFIDYRNLQNPNLSFLSKEKRK